MKTIYWIIIIIAFLNVNCNTSSEENARTAFYKQLAFAHAPIHYQDTDDSYAIADYITNVNFDGNWISTDNWNNIGNGEQLKAYVYYSVVETETHWFIVYSFFHPRDWSDNPFGFEHENDFEGALLFIRKNNSAYGIVEGMITVFHNDFYSYKVQGNSLTNGNEDIDGTLSFGNFNGRQHVKTSQEAKGHGLKAYPFGDFTGAPGQDGIIYYPSLELAELPSSGNDNDVKYKLNNITGFGDLWFLQIFESHITGDNNKTYHSWGNMLGDETDISNDDCGENTAFCDENSANLPWNWNDGDDGNYCYFDGLKINCVDTLPAGLIGLDPAYIIDYYYDGLGEFSTTYIHNQFIGDLKEQGYNDSFKPSGWPPRLKFSELYARYNEE